MNRRENGRDTIDLASLRSRLAREPQRRQWRGLDELAETREFKDYLHNEFPHDPAEEGKGVTRRDALKLMGASAALAGLSACTKLPTQKIVPYVRPPEEVVPGKPLFYATAMPLGGFAAGVLVESHMGRPTKVEGNPDHPASLGATDAFAQASVLTLYDPDRSQVIIREGRISSWGAFVAALTDARTDLLPRKGAGLRILTETVTSPTLADQIRALLAEFPQAKWHQYEPAGRDAAREGSRLAFGEYLNTVYRFDQADVILSLDADFLCSGPGAVRYARDFAARRRVVGPDSTMNRLYVVESTPSNTGAMADHRLPLRSAEVAGFAAAIAEKLGVKTGPGHGQAPSGVPADWIPAIARDLLKHRGASIVVAGDGQPPAVHALAHAMNVALGNAGKTVIYTDPVEANPVDQMQSLRELVEDIKAGQVDVLLILGSNPAYTAPADLQFAENLLKVKLRVHLGLYDDETAELCHWHIPEAHYLESWGDARAYDGTVSIIQPLIAPLYDGKSVHEVLAVLQGHPERNCHDIVQAYWKGKNLATPFEPFWETSLHNGLVAGTSLPPKQVSPKPVSSAEAAGREIGTAGQAGLEIVFRPDPTIHDGRFANNGWLQELPKPFTKLTWDNAAMVSPQTAERLSLNNEDVVELRYQGWTARAPVWIMPGHANDSITLPLGYGRRRAGKVGTGIGFNAYSLRPSNHPWFGSGLEIRKTGERYLLARTQHHHAIERGGQKVEEESVAAFDRELVRVATLEEFRKDPDFAKDPEEVTKAPSLYPGFKDEGYAWGMAIDLNSCTGCNACVVACQSENNISVVGKAEVHAGREMHWIRIDTYYQGSLDNPAVYNEPVLCMQCENAPC
ncbi:MAG TPA: TAT-variant-translocated molybdopterin oxidoreductase, partial [Terriglobia bacterium]|nr:TAT-variant-translocated molybdopterin oxidoreductase [Terriglobia bacterium]